MLVIVSERCRLRDTVHGAPLVLEAVLVDLASLIVVQNDDILANLDLGELDTSSRGRRRFLLGRPPEGTESPEPGRGSVEVGHAAKLCPQILARKKGIHQSVRVNSPQRNSKHAVQVSSRDLEEANEISEGEYHSEEPSLNGSADQSMNDRIGFLRAGLRTVQDDGEYSGNQYVDRHLHRKPGDDDIIDLRQLREDPNDDRSGTNSDPHRK